MEHKIKEIFVHCSASEWGNTDVIKEWHLARGWQDVGYHYIILNGYNSSKDIKNNIKTNKDGKIEKGRSDDVIGAHVKGRNSGSLGICLIGNKKFTKRQYLSLLGLLKRLCKKYNLTYKNILGHYEANPHKTCPNINMDRLRMLFRIFSSFYFPFN